MRPEIPEDKRAWKSKPWVNWKAGAYALWLYRRSGRPFITQVSPPRGLRHDPERTRTKYLNKRQLQGKDRR